MLPVFCLAFASLPDLVDSADGQTIVDKVNSLSNSDPPLLHKEQFSLQKQYIQSKILVTWK